MPKPTTPPAEPDQPFVRIEFQAQPDFIQQLDKARKKRGLSRSAYLRQAALMLIQQDLGRGKNAPAPPPDA